MTSAIFAPRSPGDPLLTAGPRAFPHDSPQPKRGTGGIAREADESSETHRDRLTAALRAVDELPRASRYAQHRRRLLARALELLDAPDSAARHPAGGDELERILAQLRL